MFVLDFFESSIVLNKNTSLTSLHRCIVGTDVLKYEIEVDSG